MGWKEDAFYSSSQVNFVLSSVNSFRVAKYIQEQLQTVIQEAKGGTDDHMSRIIVDEVEVTRDLKSATVFWSTMDVYSKERVCVVFVVLKNFSIDLN